MLRRILMEPMVHFSAIALLIFAVYFAMTPTPDAPAAGQIVVSAAKIEQMAVIFAKTWQRPPSPAELKALIDDYVKEEIYVREAIALGLDQDDTVVRRRLRQKMEFFSDAEADVSPPTEADLQAYLTDHPDAFAIDPKTAFQQVFLSPDARGDSIGLDAEALLTALQSSPGTDPATLGDASLLPPEMGPTITTDIAKTFGPEFADAVARLPPGTWEGPIASGFGLHLVRVSEHTPGQLPPLADVRDAVLREWKNARTQSLADARMTELISQYEVTIEAVQTGVATQ